MVLLKLGNTRVHVVLAGPEELEIGDWQFDSLFGPHHGSFSFQGFYGFIGRQGGPTDMLSMIWGRTKFCPGIGLVDDLCMPWRGMAFPGSVISDYAEREFSEFPAWTYRMLDEASTIRPWRGNSESRTSYHAYTLSLFASPHNAVVYPENCPWLQPCLLAP